MESLYGIAWQPKLCNMRASSLRRSPFVGRSNAGQTGTRKNNRAKAFAKQGFSRLISTQAGRSIATAARFLLPILPDGTAVSIRLSDHLE